MPSHSQVMGSGEKVLDSFDPKNCALSVSFKIAAIVLYIWVYLGTWYWSYSLTAISQHLSLHHCCWVSISGWPRTWLPGSLLDCVGGAKWLKVGRNSGYLNQETQQESHMVQTLQFSGFHNWFPLFSGLLFSLSTYSPSPCSGLASPCSARSWPP